MTKTTKSGFTGRWMKMRGGERRKGEKKNEEDGVWGEGRGGIRKRDEKRGSMVWTRFEEGDGGWLVEANSQRPTAGRYCIFIRWLRHLISFLPPFVSPKAVKLGRRVNEDEIIARFSPPPLLIIHR